MDYVFNEHLDFKPTWSICNTISDNIVIQLIWKFQESNWNHDWFIGLMDSIGTNYIFTNNKNLGQYDQNAIPSQIMPCYSYPGNLINQNKIPIQGSTLSFLAGCPKSHFLGWYRNFLVHWYLKLDNQVLNSTCPKNTLGWIWRADDPYCRTLLLS